MSIINLNKGDSLSATLQNGRIGAPVDARQSVLYYKDIFDSTKYKLPYAYCQVIVRENDPEDTEHPKGIYVITELDRLGDVVSSGVIPLSLLIDGKLEDITIATTKDQSSMELGRINSEDSTFRIEAGSGIKIDKWPNDLNPVNNAVQIGVDTNVIATKSDLTAKADKNNTYTKTETDTLLGAKANTADIDTIEAKIPSQATAQNQLADKDFVNSSIATATADFKGTVNSVAALDNLTANNNDYAFVVTTDQAGNIVYKRYKYNGTEWLFEYDLNNSSFTAAQWATINSGVTSQILENVAFLGEDEGQAVIPEFDPQTDTLLKTTQSLTNTEKETVISNILDKNYIDGSYVGKGKKYLKLNVGAPVATDFDGFVDGATTEQSSLAEVPDNIYFDRTNNRFIASKGSGLLMKYYMSWQDGNAYMNPNSGVYFKNGNDYYQWNGTTLEATTGSNVNKLTQADFDTENTIYVIRYDFDLCGQSITIPEGCVLEFDGGSLSNGTIVGQNTGIKTEEYARIFNAVVLNGTFKNTELSICNFGVVSDNEDASSFNATTINSYIKTSFENTKISLFVPTGKFYFNTPISFNGTFNIECIGQFVYNGVNEATAMTIGTNIGEGQTKRVERKKFRINLSTTNTQTYIDEIVPESYGLRLYNIHTCYVYLDYIAGFAYDVVLHADNDCGATQNSVFIGKLDGPCYTYLTLYASNGGWINDNIFYGGNFHHTGNPFKKDGKQLGFCIKLDADSDVNKLNNNIFIKPCFEDQGTVFYFNNARDNTVICPRMEDVVTQAYFGAVSINNIILNGFTTVTSGQPCKQFSGNSYVGQLSQLVINGAFQDVADEPIMRYDGGNVYNSNLYLLGSYTNDGTYYNIIGTNIPKKINNKSVVIFAAGFIVDASIVKGWEINTKYKAPIYYISILDDNYQPIKIPSVDKVTDKYGWNLSSNGLVISSTAENNVSKILLKDSFTDEYGNTININKIFIGASTNSIRIKISGSNSDLGNSKYSNKSLLLQPYDTRIINELPNTTSNVPVGFTLIYKDIIITWNGSKWDSNFIYKKYPQAKKGYIIYNKVQSSTLGKTETDSMVDFIKVRVPKGSVITIRGTYKDTSVAKIWSLIKYSDNTILESGTGYSGTVLYDSIVTTEDCWLYCNFYNENYVNSSQNPVPYGNPAQVPYLVEVKSNTPFIEFNHFGDTISLPVGLTQGDEGFQYFDTTVNKLITAKEITNTGTVTWVDATGVIPGTPTSGTFANKPTVATNNIPVGFRYFCTDKQTTEGATDGIEIIHKGNDVWVDALGRTIS